ncbi:hypothetical protein GCM10010411_76510 [Actinomadura fulvescens]|uniref:Uncharacterized protein n=1 Tax=Actinomadura fulvescens TaxID=46160 RepID=A0ABP6CX10_9ACTN
MNEGSDYQVIASVHHAMGSDVDAVDQGTRYCATIDELADLLCAILDRESARFEPWPLEETATTQQWREWFVDAIEQQAPLGPLTLPLGPTRRVVMDIWQRL